MRYSTLCHGAVAEENDSFRFSLWAPDAHSVAVEFEDKTRHELQSHPDGWFSVRLCCPAEINYRFVLNGNSNGEGAANKELCVPDPAARAQSGGVHGWSRTVNHDSYQWRTPQWQGRPWHEAVIYEVHAGLLGGFSSLEARLPSLAELGVTAIELMPLSEFPGERNWGYDGTLPFAAESSYGTPDELKSLIDTAHGLGLMVFIDVVYNHFGPDGNYLGQYAGGFFRDDVHTPWGPAIDFRKRQVRDYFCENALMWIQDYRVDGLRLDAVHAITEKDFLIELAERVRNAADPNRHVHLVLENENNTASLLEQGYAAQWNDDWHNVMHHLLTNEHEGYYADFSENPTQKLARCLSEGFIYQGENSRHGRSRGEPSAHLAPTAFVAFLQNHDQIGNRAFGERLINLTEADALKTATALLLLSPMVPLLFMGEEWGSRRPFLYFTDHGPELGKLVREGRQNEFRDFSIFADEEVRHSIPDPNARGTFIASIPDYTAHNEPGHQQWRAFYQMLLRLRRNRITPHLVQARVAEITMLGERAISASWRLGDSSLLRIDFNLGATPMKVTPVWDREPVIFSYRVEQNHFEQSLLPAHSIVAILKPPAR